MQVLILQGAVTPSLESNQLAQNRDHDSPHRAMSQAATTLLIEGMTCASCVRRVEKALSAVPGVEHASVNLATHQAVITHTGKSPSTDDAPMTSPPSGFEGAALAAVEGAGYSATVVSETQGPSGNPGSVAETHGAHALSAEDARARRDRMEVIAALALSLPLALPMLLQPFSMHVMVPAWMQFLLATVVLFGLGRRFFVQAWRALKGWHITMDTLVVLGTVAAWALSVWLWRSDPAGSTHRLYFESAALVIAFVLLGRWLEARAKARTVAALRSLHALRPATVMLKRDGVIVKRPLADVRLGDTVIVAPSERVAVDGTVTDGATHVDESTLTGESTPVAKAVGDTLLAGTLNAEGQVTINVTAVGAQTSLGRIVTLVETAQATKPPIQQLVDRVAEWFVPAVVVIAVLTYLGWMFAGASTATAIIHAVSVLVIACPCALGLATPAALMVGTGLAARHGILVREATALEALKGIKLVAFDKTGTLTEPDPRLIDVIPANADVDGNRLVLAAAAMQAALEHPLARALQREAGLRSKAPLPIAQDVEVVAGRGVSGIVQGSRLLLGSERWMEHLHVDRAALESRAREHRKKGHTVSWLAVHTPATSATSVTPDVSHGSIHALALMVFASDVKPDAKRVVNALRSRGVRTVMISGDSADAAKHVADVIGIEDVRAPVMPADKARIVRELRDALHAPGDTVTKHPVAMVGDGVNDAPALAAADVGIAMGQGTDVAMETAGITLMHSKLGHLLDAMDLSQAVSTKIKQNLFWAFAYNVIGIPLAAVGLLSPVVAGAAMALSSVCVVGNALWLKRWTPRAA